MVSPAQAAVPENETSIQLIYTGMTGGLTQSRVEFAPLWALFDVPEQQTYQAGGFREDNVFRCGERLIFTDQGPLTLRDLERFLAAGPCHIGTPEPIVLARTDNALVLELGNPRWGLPTLAAAISRTGRFPTTQERRAYRYQLVNPTGTTLYMVELWQAPLDPCRPLEPLAEWELVPAVTVELSRTSPGQERTRLLAAGRPLGEGLRRSRLARRWREQALGRSLTLDLGNILEPGDSEGARTRRAFTLTHLQALGLDALVPGEAELALSPAEWDSLASGVTLLAANVEHDPPASAPFRPWLERRVGGVRVAVLGLTDNRAFEAAGLAGRGARWRVNDPVGAARRALEALSQRPAETRPHLVAIATNLRDDRLQQLRHLDGVSAVLADMEGLPGEVVEETVAVRGEERALGQRALIVARSSANRVGRLEATFTRGPAGRLRLARIRNEARLVTDNLPQEPSWRSELNILRDRYQRRRRELLLPDLRDLGLTDGGNREFIDTARWNTLVAQLAWRVSGAEVVVMRRLALDLPVIGPVSRLAAERWLELGDRLVDVVLSGKALRQLASATPGGTTFAGFDPKTAQVLGAPVGDDELYRITTTDLTMRLPGLREVFGEASTRDRWRSDSWERVRPDESGSTLLLRDQVIASLKGLKASRNGAFDETYRKALRAWLVPGAQPGPPRWTMRLDDGELLTNSLRGAEDPAFSQVRNTRATAPSSLTLGGRGRLGVLYDSQDWGLEQRARGIYKRSTLVKDGREVVQETDDEFSLTSEFRAKRLARPVGMGTITPFGSGTYTTEFVPDVTNGVTKPRRSELAAIGGLLWSPGSGERDWRLGAALKNDLANPGLLEPGLYLAGGWERSLAPVLPARLKSGVELFRYAATPTDTPDRLGLQATLTAGLSIPLWDRLTLNVGADWFVFSGKVPETDRLRTSADFRVGLGYSLAWKPLHQLWF